MYIYINIYKVHVYIRQASLERVLMGKIWCAQHSVLRLHLANIDLNVSVFPYMLWYKHLNNENITQAKWDWDLQQEEINSDGLRPATEPSKLAKNLLICWHMCHHTFIFVVDHTPVKRKMQSCSCSFKARNAVNIGLPGEMQVSAHEEIDI